MQCKFAEEGYEKLSGVQRCDENDDRASRSALMPVLGTLLIMCETTTRQVSSTLR
jgi:hypothetical protein